MTRILVAAQETGAVNALSAVVEELLGVPNAALDIRTAGEATAVFREAVLSCRERAVPDSAVADIEWTRARNERCPTGRCPDRYRFRSKNRTAKVVRPARRRRAVGRPRRNVVQLSAAFS